MPDAMSPAKKIIVKGPASALLRRARSVCSAFNALKLGNVGTPTTNCHWGYLFSECRVPDRSLDTARGDVLESVYVVVEAVGETSVAVKVDDFWIACLDWTNA